LQGEYDYVEASKKKKYGEGGDRYVRYLKELSHEMDSPLKTAVFRIYKPLVADSHHFDEEQDPDPH
jgi:hypothetical protein